MRYLPSIDDVYKEGVGEGRKGVFFFLLSTGITNVVVPQRSPISVPRRCRRPENDRGDP